MSAIKIVKATDLDCKNIVILKEQLAKQSNFVMYDDKAKELDKDMETQINNHSCIYYLVKTNGYLQGHIYYRICKELNVGKITIGVMKKYQRKGLGEKLLTVLITELKKARVKRDVMVLVDKTNEVGLKLFTKAGFNKECDAILKDGLLYHDPYTETSPANKYIFMRLVLAENSIALA